MLNIPEEIKTLFRQSNVSKKTVRYIKLRFYEEDVNLLFPDDALFPANDLFPIDIEPFLTIENSLIQQESLTLVQHLCAGENMRFGECTASILEIIVADIKLDLTGKEFLLTVEIGDYELALGIFKVDSFERQADRRLKKITAYDRIRKFEVDVAEWYNQIKFPVTLKQFRDALCERVGIKQIDMVLPLDDMQVSKTIEPAQLKAWDVIEFIAEVNGCFGQMDRTGQLKYITLGVSGLYPDDDLFPDENLYPAEMINPEVIPFYRPSDTKYKDYVVRGIDKLQFRQEEGDIGVSVGNGTNCYTIQGNFLLYGKSGDELLQIALKTYEQISGRLYRPARISCPALPWVEPGDGIICYTTDDVIETYCMKRTIKGIQSMSDAFEANGSQLREEKFGIGSQIIQLEGKTAVIKKNVNEVSVKLTDLKEFTEAQFKITAEQILAEVTRAQEAEAALSIKADEISLSVKNLKEYAESEFKQTAELIALKVSKGDVSSQLSIEPDDIIIKSNRFSWEANNSSMTKEGKLTCDELRATNAYVSGVLETDIFYAGDDEVRFGDWFVSADGSNTLESDSGYIKISQGKIPGGYGKVTITGEGSTTTITQGRIDCGTIYLSGSWWDGWSLEKEIRLLHDAVFG